MRVLQAQVVWKQKINQSREKSQTKRKNDGEVSELMTCLEQSEKREREFFFQFAEMEKGKQEKNIKLIADIAKILKN